MIVFAGSSANGIRSQRWDADLRQLRQRSALSIRRWQVNLRIRKVTETGRCLLAPSWGFFLVFYFAAKITTESILQPVRRTLCCLDQFAGNKTSNEPVPSSVFGVVITSRSSACLRAPVGSSWPPRMTRKLFPAGRPARSDLCLVARVRC